MQIDNKPTQPAQNVHVVLSKIKIIRNFKDYPFVSSITKENKARMEHEIIKHVSNWQQKSTFFDMTTLSDTEKKMFLDKNIINENFTKNKEGKFIVFPKNSVVMLLNNNDHIDISVIQPNLSLKSAYKKIEEIEKKLGKTFPYAASTKYGFLTSYIKDCGLSLKLSAILHLPGLHFMKKTKSMSSYFLRRGYNISPLYKDSETKKNSDYFIMSSMINFGISEEQLIQDFTLTIKKLINKDHVALLKYYKNNKASLIDAIYRSYGILKHATKMGYQEALDLLSNLRIGSILNEKVPIDIDVLNKLFIKIKDGNVIKIAEKENIEKNVARCNIIKNYLKLTKN